MLSKVSKSIAHDRMNSLIYIWPALKTKVIYVHFYGENGSTGIDLKKDESFFLNWHKIGLGIKTNKYESMIQF